MDPLQQFKEWYATELAVTTVPISAACCLSTIGLDGYPNARFLALKDVMEDTLVITGPLQSRKGTEIYACDKVALSFWWTNTKRQVRIQGNASKIPTNLAEKYFSERERDAKIVSSVSNQGQLLNNVDELNLAFNQYADTHRDKEIACPVNWRGYHITPVRIEFMEFQPTRFHSRELFERVDGKWITQQLQP